MHTRMVHSHAFLLQRRSAPASRTIRPRRPGGCAVPGPFARLQQLEGFCWLSEPTGKMFSSSAGFLSPAASPKYYIILHLSSRAGACAYSLGWVLRLRRLSSLAIIRVLSSESLTQRVSVGRKLSLIVALTEFNPIVIFHHSIHLLRKGLCLGVSFSFHFSSSHSSLCLAAPRQASPGCLSHAERT